MTPEKINEGFLLQQEMRRIEKIISKLSITKSKLSIRKERYYTRINYQTQDYTGIDVEVIPTEEYDRFSKCGQEAIRKLEKTFINNIKSVYESELEIAKKKFSDL